MSDYIKRWYAAVDMRVQKDNEIIRVVRGDSNSNELVLTLVDNGIALDLTKAINIDIKINFNNGIKFEGPMIIENAKQGVVSYKLSNNIMGYIGLANCSIKITFNESASSSTMFALAFVDNETEFEYDDYMREFVKKDVSHYGVVISDDRGIKAVDNNMSERFRANRKGVQIKGVNGSTVLLNDKGIVQSWQQYFKGSTPLVMDLYIPSNVRALHKVLLMFKSSLTNPALKVKVNEVDETDFLGGGTKFTTNQDALDITSIVNNTGHTKIELTSDSTSTVEVSIFIQAFVETIRKSIVVGSDV